MELPHIGTHCAQPTCHKLDFLPFMCNLCKKNFCVDHHKYDAHACPESHLADVQVPICPLCDQPVPSRPGQPPDLAVNAHLENNCTDIKKKKIYGNRCSARGCKTKEMVPIRCDSCRLNYCLPHRHPTDHQCQGAATARQQALLAAQKRTSNNSATRTTLSQGSSGSSGSRERSSQGGIHRFFSSSSGNPTPTGHTPAPQRTRTSNISALQGGMSEDEALAQAMAASMAEGSQSMDRQEGAAGQGTEEEDAQLARAIAASMSTSQQRSNNSSSLNSCVIC
ncbi:hypothetical protein Pmani_025634 [Petrolisthes manimaculis]|uniref:AN1-type domain-containing protein n=1 Tax=Petrolisthes manimaculis TaxID=1843537 RepID=A0AAE1TYQ9_9EUCA|nr:hypothetical protein Pmani_025634 [Petrolisthes manimaculis]